MPTPPCNQPLLQAGCRRAVGQLLFGKGSLLRNEPQYRYFEPGVARKPYKFIPLQSEIVAIL